MILIPVILSLISTQRMSDTSFSTRPLEGISHILFPPRDKQVLQPASQPAEGAAMIHICIPINKNNHNVCPGVRLQNHNWSA